MEQHRIPIFPLNVVLFPGMRLPLHIFEPRYQKMIRRCLETDRTFGVCLIRSGVEVGGPADPCEIGTTCEILATEPLDGGRMNLITIGKERFRIEEVFQEDEYLEASVTLQPEGEPASLEPLPDEVHAALMDYVNLLLARHGRAPLEIRLPDEPLALSRAAGAILQVSSEERQELLEAEVPQRLRRELEILRRENARLELETREAPLVARPFELDPARVSPN